MELLTRAVSSAVIGADRALAAVGVNAYQLLFVLGILSLYPGIVGIYATRGTHNNPQKIYERVRRFPLGGWLFYRLIISVNPFSKSIGFSVVEYTRTKCVLAMQESQAVRNPFRSIHAGALATFAETAGGLAAMGQLRRQDRFIPTELHCTYLAKARGRITAICTYVVPTQPGRYEADVPVTIVNETGEVVCKVRIVARLEVGVDGAPKRD